MVIKGYSPPVARSVIGTDMRYSGMHNMREAGKNIVSRIETYPNGSMYVQ